MTAKSIMMGLGPSKLLIAIFLVVVQIVRSSRSLDFLPNQGFKGAIISERAWQRNAWKANPPSVVRVRGGGARSKAKENYSHKSHLIGERELEMQGENSRWKSEVKMLGEICIPWLVNAVTDVETFCRDRVLPTARNARHRFVRGMNDYRERKSRERDEQLKRNEMWREKAEQNATPSANRNRIGKTSYSSFSPSLLSESTRAYSSSSFRPASLKMVLLPTRLLKLSMAAFLLAEILDRIGVVDTPEIVKYRIKDFWKQNVLRAYANIRSRWEGWIFELQIREREFEMRGENGKWWWCLLANPCDGPAVWSTTKAAFAFGTACGMISTPLFFPWASRLWRQVFVIVGIAETNHYFKMRGKKFVELLGETPQTVGAILDGMLERCRKVVRRVIYKVVRSEEDCNYERYGSGRSNSGSVDDPYRETIRMGLVSGSRGVSRSKKERRKNSNDLIYSLGISAYRSHTKRDGWRHYHGRAMGNFCESDACEIELYNHKRMAMAKQGLILGCVIGLAIEGRCYKHENN